MGSRHTRRSSLSPRPSPHPNPLPRGEGTSRRSSCAAPILTWRGTFGVRILKSLSTFADEPVGRFPVVPANHIGRLALECFVGGKEVLDLREPARGDCGDVVDLLEA